MAHQHNIAYAEPYHQNYKKINYLK